jgi:hypothetical protein
MLCVLCIVTTDPRALFCLSDGSLQWFTHFGSHYSTEFMFLLVEDTSGTEHHLGASFECCAAVGLKGISG